MAEVAVSLGRWVPFEIDGHIRDAGPIQRKWWCRRILGGGYEFRIAERTRLFGNGCDKHFVGFVRFEICNREIVNSRTINGNDFRGIDAGSVRSFGGTFAVG